MSKSTCVDCYALFPKTYKYTCAQCTCPEWGICPFCVESNYSCSGGCGKKYCYGCGFRREPCSDCVKLGKQYCYACGTTACICKDGYNPTPCINCGKWFRITNYKCSHCETVFYGVCQDCVEWRYSCRVCNKQYCNSCKTIRNKVCENCSCTLCHRGGHTTTGHVCSVCKKTGHSAMNHCAECKVLGHTAGYHHRCRICDGEHNTDEHFCSVCGFVLFYQTAEKEWCVPVDEKDRKVTLCKQWDAMSKDEKSEWGKKAGKHHSEVLHCDKCKGKRHSEHNPCSKCVPLGVDVRDKRSHHCHIEEHCTLCGRFHDGKVHKCTFCGEEGHEKDVFMCMAKMMKRITELEDKAG